MQRFQLTSDYSISRIIKGGWHLAGGHGKIDRDLAIADMAAFVNAGITTFDCADIYTGVEELIGAFRQKYQDQMRDGEMSKIQVHTKYVPDYDALESLTFAATEKIIDRSLSRLGMERLDLVQFAWWDYLKGDYVDAAGHLQRLKEAGKIRYVAATNFSYEAHKKIEDAGIDLVSEQIQYSVLDHRPEKDYAKDETPFLCYGVLAGGFLSNRYLWQPDPEAPLENRSLTKYRLIIDEFGGYEKFQDLITLLNDIANRYEVGIAEVAARYILDKPKVGAAIIGARNATHLPQLQKVFSFRLSEIDKMKIAQFQDGGGPAGPVYDLERDKEGKHGRIMKYNLNS